MKFAISLPHLFVALLLSLSFINCTSPVPGPPEDPYVESLLEQMTLEEKVGQMTQVTLEFVSKGEGYKMEQPHHLDPEKLENVLVNHHVGSVLNCAGQPHTPERWHELISEIQDYAAKTRLKIPVLYGIDAIHGVNYTIGATLYPQEVGLAASWNPELVKAAAKMTAYETRASGIPWTFSPTLDLGVNPEWPRLWESFGEDPYLMQVMGVAMTEGYQGDDVGHHERIAACLKHYIGYGAPVSGKDRTPAWIPENILREYFLPPFKAAIDAGALSIMINSGEVNGEAVHASHFLLTTLLRDELGFKGVAVTDWYDIWNLVERHHVAADRRTAVKMAIDAGVDMAMVPLDLEFSQHLVDLVNAGEISMERIDLSVRRILRMKKQLGLFDTPLTTPDAYPDFGSAKHRQLAYDLAAESITLLKNQNDLLPLNKATKILVAGPNAHSMRSLNGGWSYTWQGERTDEFTEAHMTLLEAVQDRFGKEQVNYVPGVQYKKTGAYHEDELIDLKALDAAARQADVLLLCVGENSYTEKPGDLKSMELSYNQQELVRAALATQKPVILVLNEGRPRIIGDTAEGLAAVLQIYLPGNSGGEALADVLMGKVNPSGKLPYTYPRHSNELVPYYHKYSEASPHNDGNEYAEPFFNPQWEFGYGLSYSSFEYDMLETDKASYALNDTIALSVNLSNTGSLPGKEVVQLYSSDLVASLTPSVKRLRAFDKVRLEAGEQRKIHFTLAVQDLAFVGNDMKWKVEAGAFELSVGKQKVQIRVE